MKSEIIAIGSEMLTPFRQDTNSLAVTEKLNGLGITVAFKTIVGDRRKDLVNAIRTALGRVDVLIITGGLGPTEDDLTREAVAETLNLTLRRDATLVAALHVRVASWRMPMPPNNQKQADLLEGATVLPNAHGSAPGQWLDTIYEGYRKLIVLLPGPPRECIPMFDDECLPRLREVAPPRAIAVRTLKAAMIPESQADSLLAPIYTTYTDVETTFWRTPATFSSPCNAPSPPPRRRRRASTSWPAKLKKHSATTSTPRKTNRSNRSCSTTSG
jgi:nicotinamide-nucleotide amidase